MEAGSGQSFGQAMRGGVIWSAAAFFASRGFNLISLLVLARLLVPSEFGVVAAILVFLGLLELASDLGMGATLVYEQEKGVSRRVQVAFTVNFALAIVLTGLGVLFAPQVAAFFHLENEVGLFRLAALNLLAIGLGNIHDKLLLRGMEFRRRTLPPIVRSLVRGVVSMVLAAEGLGAESLVYGMLAGTVVWTVALWLLVPFRPKFVWDAAIARSMASYGGAASALEVLGVVASRADAAIVGRVLGERALGLYSIAFRIPELVIDSISWNISIVAFPALARKRAEDVGGLPHATVTQLRYQALAAVPLAVLLAILAPPLIVVLFSETWREAGGVMSAVAVTSGMIAVAFPLGDVFKAIGRQRTIIALNTVNLPALIGTVILLAPSGILAVAWGRAAVAACFCTLLIGFVMRVLSIRVRAVVDALGPAVAAGLGVAVGAGAVRLAWSDLTLGPLLAGLVAGSAGGYLAVRIFAPATLATLRGQLSGVLPRLRIPRRLRRSPRPRP